MKIVQLMLSNIQQFALIQLLSFLCTVIQINGSLRLFEFNRNRKITMLNQQAEENSFIEKDQRQSDVYSQSTLTKISNFLEMKQIDISEFWKSDHNCASADDIIAFCKGCGLTLNTHDRINLKGELFSNKEMIYLDKFAQLISFWKVQGKEAVSDFLKQRSDVLLQKLHTKDKKRAKSGIPRQRSALEIRTMSRQGSATRLRKQGTQPSFTQNNSMKYLRKFKQRELVKEKQLSENIQKNKIDEQYGMLLKMSELNTINKERESNIAYRAYKSAEGIIKVRVFNLNKFEKEISLKEFDTIYKNFKKTTKQNKDWAFAAPNQPKQTDELQILKNRNTQKSQRQQQLKNLLVNTVNLTNLLKEQIKIFKMKGIYGCESI